MKKILTILSFLMASTLFAQVPQAINYQAVATNTSGTPIANSNISVRISILAGSATGTNVYTETHSTTTSPNGIFNVEIGRGNVVSGNFPNIQWYAQPHFAKIDIDVNGGTNYQTIGTTQFLSVPYALFAENVAMIFGIDKLFASDTINLNMNHYYDDNQSGFYNLGGYYPKSSLCNLIKWYGGEAEDISVNMTGLNSNIKIDGISFPYTVQSSKFLNEGSNCPPEFTISVDKNTPIGIYPITVTATNPRGRQKSKINYVNVTQSCNSMVSTENGFVGNYNGKLIISGIVFVSMNDTISIINPINNDGNVTMNLSSIGNVVCTLSNNELIGSFSNKSGILNMGVNYTYNNVSGTIKAVVCNGILYTKITLTNGTAGVDGSSFSLSGSTWKGTYTK